MLVNSGNKNQYRQYIESHQATPKIADGSKSSGVQTASDFYTSTIASDVVRESNFTSSTKIYIDAVIKNASSNIERGINVEENQKILSFYSGLLQTTTTQLYNTHY